MEKVLKSAVANAEANHGLYGEELIVSSAYVDEGPTIKRWRARARGRVARIRKRTCHITVRLIENPKAASQQAPKKAAAATTEAPPKADSGSKPKAPTRRKKKEVNA